jgi:hypothetical protein
MYGNGRCQVRTAEKEMSCVIRNKFKGRSKRGNIVSVGSSVLVGLREWEEKSGYKTCDILEIYDEEDKNKLKNEKGYKELFPEEKEEYEIMDMYETITPLPPIEEKSEDIEIDYMNI